MKIRKNNHKTNNKIVSLNPNINNYIKCKYKRLSEWIKRKNKTQFNVVYKRLTSNIMLVVKVIYFNVNTNKRKAGVTTVKKK